MTDMDRIRHDAKAGVGHGLLVAMGSLFTTLAPDLVLRRWWLQPVLLLGGVLVAHAVRFMWMAWNIDRPEPPSPLRVFDMPTVGEDR